MHRHARALLAAALIAGVCGVAAADQVTVSGLPYPNVEIIDCSNCRITYTLRGRSIRKPMSDVVAVTIDGQDALNQAEKQLAAKQPAKAVALYDRALASAKRDWMKRLIRHRRLRAADAAGMTGRAVQDWLAIVDANPGTRAALALAPKKMGPRGSAENAKAISLLEERLKATKDTGLTARIRRLLRDLYTLEGQTEKIEALTSAAPAAGGDDNGDDDGAAPPVTFSSGSLSGQLKEAAEMLEAGRYAAAADGIKARLRRYTAAELPTALLLRGKALLMMYEKGGSRDRQTLLDAGLCFMRVAACHDPALEGVPEATYLAGRVCELLGNKVAAQNTYRWLIDRHAPDNEWVARAKQALGGG